MRKIRILTLEYCDACMWLKSELEREKIEYVNIDANSNIDFANDIEKKFQTEFYPIIFMEGETDVITILPATKLEPSPTLLTFQTIPEAINLIKSNINK